VADNIGLNTGVVRGVLQNLASTKIIQRSADGSGHKWKIESVSIYKILERILVKKEISILEREAVEGEMVVEDNEDF
jgi:hypothetical protein